MCRYSSKPWEKPPATARSGPVTKAAVESSIDNIDQAVGQEIPEQSRQWLGMMGFRVIIDDGGHVVEIEMPTGGIEEDDDY